MLRSINEVIGYQIAATDGDIGNAHDFLFDDQAWIVRHLVVDTGRWLPGRKVLIAPEALGSVDWEQQMIAVALTREKIEQSPSVDTDQPVSRQQEIEMYRYYAWAPYWSTGLAGPYPLPSGVTVPEQPGQAVEEGDSHLRSVRHVKGYHVSAADGEIGHIEDFIVDDETWRLRYVVVDTRNWLPGRKVLVALQWLRQFDWAERKVGTDLEREAIKHGPDYDPAIAVNRAYEERLYDFHGRPKYWLS